MAYAIDSYTPTWPLGDSNTCCQRNRISLSDFQNLMETFLVVAWHDQKNVHGFPRSCFVAVRSESLGHRGHIPYNSWHDWPLLTASLPLASRPGCAAYLMHTALANQPVHLNAIMAVYPRPCQLCSCRTVSIRLLKSSLAQPSLPAAAIAAFTWLTIREKQWASSSICEPAFNVAAIHELRLLSVQ